MGFASILDILGSIIIGGILLLITFRLNDSATEKTYNYSGELSLQQNLTTIADIVENDFRKIGFCADYNKYPDPGKAIVFGGESSITFLADIDQDTNMDSVRYYVGPVSELSSTPNPRDRLLYRVVNNETPRSSNLGVTQFHLIYFDALGDTLPPPITTPGIISSFEINLSVENVAAYDTAYTGAFWRQIRLVARNLRNR